jgi:hypothetical protein
MLSSWPADLISRNGDRMQRHKEAFDRRFASVGKCGKQSAQ